MQKNKHVVDAQLYVRILENVEEAVVAIDRAGRIALFNPSAQSYTGLSERQSLGKHFEDLFAGQQGILYPVLTALRDRNNFV